MIRHTLALQRGAGAVDCGANSADALQSVLRSTGGFNRKTKLARQLETCNAQELVELIRTLQSFTRATRANSTLSAQRLTRLLLSRSGGRRDGSR
jgi:hypothetical protein